ncbi:transposase [Chloroflexota bacterium]
MIEEPTTKTITCKNCGSPAVVKFGTYRGTQRYWCKSCQRKFKADDTEFHMKVPANHISSAVSMYYSGSSINDIRDFLKQEYDYYPSKSVVFKWVEKYTDLAAKHFKDYHPKVGDTWIADETMLNIDGQHQVWFYDIIDEKTRYLLASRVALSRTTHNAEMLMKDAAKRAGKAPKVVITDKNYSYLDGIERAFGADTEHRQSKPFTKEDTTNLIERFHGTLKDRTKVMRSFRDIETLIQFANGWLIYYNFFKPHTSLKGKTPAEMASLKYDVKNWADLASVPVPKYIELQRHTAPRLKLPKTKTSLEHALKRKRKPKQSRMGNQILVQQAKSGGTLVSRKRVRGTRLIGRMGVGR